MDRLTVSLRVPPDSRWGELVRDAALDFGHACGFARGVTEMSADALLECVEEYVRVCGERSAGDPFTLEMEGLPDALSFRLVYPRTVPLNPMQQDDYEIPDGGADIGGLDLSGLWLHLVKRKVDRVFFRRDGDAHSLHLVKYRRDPGKIRQHWVMALAPRLADGVQVDEKTAEGPSGGILQRPGTGRVVRLDPVALYVVKRLDGRTTFWQIYLDSTDHVGVVSPQRMGAIYETLEAGGFLAGPGVGPKRAGRWLDFLERLFALDFGTSGADRFVSALHRGVRFLFHPAAVFAAAVASLAGIFPAVWHRGELAAAIRGLDQAVFGEPLLALALYLAFLAAVAVHELGHGLTCKHFGGRVNRFGVMFYLAMFIFYCDVSSAWNFPRRRDRLLVSLGGPLTTAFLASGCFWAFHWLPAGAVFARTAAGVLGVVLAFGFLMNFNPFIKMDGYYMLMDLTECPNLRRLAFGFLRFRLLRGERPAGLDPSRLTPRMKRLFWAYGLGGVAVTLVFLVRPAWYFAEAMLSGPDVRSGRLLLAVVVLAVILARFALRAARATHERRHRSWKLK